jgi:peptidoglycan/LPS O-acetylase OafA/YrhL
VAEPATHPEARRNSFDAVRMGAAFAVLIGHQFDLAGYYRPGLAQPALGPLGLKLSDLGLYVFFALSGYLVCQSLLADARPGRFLSARFLRIYPGAIANTLLCVLFGAVDTVLPESAYWHDAQTWSFLAHNLPILIVPTQFGLPGVLADARWPAVNVPIWTLKYELLDYLVLLGLVWAVPRRRPALRLALAAAATLATAAFIVTRLWPPEVAGGTGSLTGYEPVHFVRFLTVFFAGAFYAAAEPLGPGSRLLTLVVPGALVSFAPVPEVARAGLLLLVALLSIEIGRSPYLYSATYRRIGDLSYGTYLYAFPIQLLSLTRWLDALGFWPVMGIDIALILGCAFLSWHLVERPALRLKRGRRVAGAETPPAPTPTRTTAPWPNPR